MSERDSFLPREEDSREPDERAGAGFAKREKRPVLSHETIEFLMLTGAFVVFSPSGTPREPVRAERGCREARIGSTPSGRATKPSFAAFVFFELQLLVVQKMQQRKNEVLCTPDERMRSRRNDPPSLEPAVRTISGCTISVAREMQNSQWTSFRKAVCSFTG